MSVILLSIETSCDETAAAVIQDGNTVLSDVINTQIDLHKIYGGVVPEIASRLHIEKISQVVEQALERANIGLKDIDAVAVTYGPGLIGALLVGLSYAKGLSYALSVPLIGVHHIKGHVFANFIAHPELKPPFVCLVASGGHSHIVKVSDFDRIDVLAKTRDDAPGEAFDKIARVLGLPYPGGPEIEKAAQNGNENAYLFPKVTFDDTLDFSFSGVKTAVINTVHKAEQKGERVVTADIAASFQKAVCDILTENTIKAANKSEVKTIALAGGVAANGKLRESMAKVAKENGLTFYCPPLRLCTDNAVMIGCAGYYQYCKKDFIPLSQNGFATLTL